jgi:hypothetical protein
MTHTYRDPDVLNGRFLGPSALASCVFVVVFFLAPLALGWVPFRWDTARFIGIICGVVFVLQYFGYRRQAYGICGEIRLCDDGTCELETKRRVIRLHVNEIRSVRFWRETDERSESYTIHYRSGKLDVSNRMTAFADFLTGLKTLNPAVDLTSFPAEAWPGLGGQPATEERGTFVRHFMRTALFPLIVISLLVYLASQKLVGSSP